MSERYWYYIKDEQPEGPVSEGELRTMLEGTELGPETLVWSEATVTWTPASQVEGLGGTTGVATLASPPASVPTPASEVPQARPWVRFWARQLDMVLAVVLLGLLLAFTAPSLLEMDTSGRVTGVVCLFLWVFVETLLLSTWGTTPGKWLLGIRLRDSTGRKLSFARVFTRSLSVWWNGLGIGIPYVMLCTLYIAYQRLRDEGVTSWDRQGEFVVSHERIGIGRIIGAILIVAGFKLWMAWATWTESR